MKAPFPKPFLSVMSSLDHQENVPLAPFSTLKVGGAASFLLHAHNLSDVAKVQKACQEYDIALHILSGGSNTLFGDNGFPGLVIKLSKHFDTLLCSSDGLKITVGAASSFAKLSKKAVSLGWETAVGFTGTPGLIGGALKMNAGTNMGVIGDVVEKIFGLDNGQYVEINKKDINFSYRSCSIGQNIIITGAQLACNREKIKEASYLNKKVIDYQIKRRTTQPSHFSAGSFFKNPYPHFAGALIEKCNMKGLQYKNAQISDKHANFIVNNGGAKASDIINIAHQAQRRVWEQVGIKLQPEIRLAGDFTDEETVGKLFCLS